MLTRQEQWIKWSLYAGVVAALTLLELLVLGDVRLFGVRFFLPPLFVGVIASMEGLRAGMVFGTVYGVLCDLTLVGTFPCVYTIAFVLAAFLCAAIAQSVLQPGVICSFAVTLLTFTVLNALNMLSLTLSDQAPFLPMLSIALRETLVSCLLLAAVHPVLMWLHKRFLL
ncbi:MAG: rod shape-determining protein MreD [Oscillospiraceae bacterium]|nr:rod shape-determining protein MreD [Oscillospiraceae bacterium]